MRKSTTLRRLTAGTLTALVLIASAGTAGCSLNRSVNLRYPGTDIPVVDAIAATDAVATLDDAADDAAIWVHPTNPALSLVLGTNKKAGLEVYDLKGIRLQALNDGLINNVDIVQFPAGPDLAFGTNRTDNSITVYTIDAASRAVRIVPEARIPTGVAIDADEVYGIGAYVLPTATADPVAHVVLAMKSGHVMVYRVAAPTASRQAWSHEMIEHFQVGTQIEGVVADVATGRLFIGEEAVGVWAYRLPGLPPAAEDDEAPARVLVDVVRAHVSTSRRRSTDAYTPAGGNLASDVEGLALVRGTRAAYLIVSCQGEDRFAVYNANSLHYMGSVRVRYASSAGFDPVTHTDGVTALALPLGPAFPSGAMVMQDDNDGSPQNFKFVSWADVERALDLEPVRP
jgi:3-phytase